MAPDGFAMWVYRDGRRRVEGARVARELEAAAARTLAADGEARRRAAIDALVALGAVEAALADAGAPSAREVASLSDRVASVALGAPPDAAAARDLARVALPRELVITRPEGFAYYGLHPESFARAAEGLSEVGLVVGVRSIGAPLSAIVTSALARRGVRAERVTVRPEGPPYDRRLHPPDEVRAALARARDSGARVVVVDEGPGISGSTLLATAEACVGVGVARERVTILGSRAPDPDALAAPDGASRWRAFATLTAPGDVRTPAASRDLSAGAWRALRLGDEGAWPASWTTTERRKLLSPDGRELLKFEGLGEAGRDVLGRARALAGAAFAPAVHEAGDGYLAYEWLSARPMSPRDLDAPVLDRLATYCAARPSLCPAEGEPAALAPMAAKNLAVAFGDAPALDLPCPRPAVVDGRMAPHEWLRPERGALVKTDGASHGDDHFFPGPTDIAWDLAGVIVEWELGPRARERFLRAYQAASGDDPRARIDAWCLAYVAFRLGAASMGRAALDGTTEAPRLDRDVARYRGCAARLVSALVSRSTRCRGG